MGVVLRFIGFGPSLAVAKAFSRSGLGGIFSLFSRVIWEWLSIGLYASWPGSGLSGSIFSGPDDCAYLVIFFLKSLKVNR